MRTQSKRIALACGLISSQKLKLLFVTNCFKLSPIFTLRYSTSTIEHCASIRFSVHISNPMWFVKMRHSYSIFDVFRRCKMRYACNAMCRCFPHSQSISIFCVQISSFVCFNAMISDTWFVCYGAECDMPATQSNILHSKWFELVQDCSEKNYLREKNCSQLHYDTN